MPRQQAYAHYKTDAGEPRFARSVVLYFDLLGVAQMAKDDDALAYLQKLRPALEEAAEYAETDDEDEPHTSAWFTDNLVVATPIMAPLQDEEGALLFTFIRASYLHLPLLEAGFLGRGAVGFGDHYIDDRFVFGPALIDAVKAEEQTTYPRIALTSSAHDLACLLVEGSDAAPREVPHIQCLARDSDGETTFIDWIGSYLGEEDDEAGALRLLTTFRERVIQGLAQTESDPRANEKWRWMADYFNWALRNEFFDAVRLDSTPGEHQFEAMFEHLES